MIIPYSEKSSCAEIRTSMNIEAIKKDTITFIHKRSTPHRVCGVCPTLYNAYSQNNNTT